MEALRTVTRHNDPMQGVIRDPDNSRLQTILRFGDMALKMAGKKGKRVKQLCRHLLATSHRYVFLGKFTADFLEK